MKIKDRKTIRELLENEEQLVDDVFAEREDFNFDVNLPDDFFDDLED